MILIIKYQGVAPELIIQVACAGIQNTTVVQLLFNLICLLVMIKICET